MPLRYTSSPDIDTTNWTPQTEYMLAGVQQAQQRHDVNQANWQKTIEEGLSKGYIDSKSREKYIEDQTKLWDDVIGKNYGNLAAGTSDVLKAVSSEKGHQWHNLNATQLKEAERLKAGLDTYGAANTLVFNDPTKISLNQDGEWVNPNTLTADFTKADEYDKNLEDQVLQIAARITGTQTDLLKSNAPEYYQSIKNDLKTLTREEILAKYLNKDAYKTFLANNPTALLDYRTNVGGNGEYDKNSTITVNGRAVKGGQNNIFSSLESFQEWGLGQLQDYQRDDKVQTRQFVTNQKYSKDYDYALAKAYGAGQKEEEAIKQVTTVDATKKNPNQENLNKKNDELDEIQFDDKGNVLSSYTVTFPQVGFFGSKPTTKTVTKTVEPDKVKKSQDMINNIYAKYPETKSMTPKQAVQYVKDVNKSAESYNKTYFNMSSGWAKGITDRIFDKGGINFREVKLNGETYNLNDERGREKFAIDSDDIGFGEITTAINKLTSSDFFGKTEEVMQEIQKLGGSSTVDPVNGNLVIEYNGKTMEVPVSKEFSTLFTGYGDIDRNIQQNNPYGYTAPNYSINPSGVVFLMRQTRKENKNGNTANKVKIDYEFLPVSPVDKDGNYIDYSTYTPEDMNGIFDNNKKSILPKSGVDEMFKRGIAINSTQLTNESATQKNTSQETGEVDDIYDNQ